MLNTKYISTKERAFNKMLGMIDMNWDALLAIVFSFLISRASVIDGLTPFGIAFLASAILSGKSSIYVFISTILGIFSFHGIGGFDYVIAATIIMILYNRIKDISELSIIRSSIITATVFIIIELIYSIIFRELFLYEFFIVAFEGFIVFAMTYIFSYSISPEAYGGSNSNEKIICTFITIALVLSGLDNLMFYGISIKNIISILLILYFGYSEGAFVGSTVGIALGLVSYISHPEMPFILAIFGLGGLLSGIFRELGKLGSILGFILGNSIISFYINGYGISFLNLKEIILSIIAFSILYKPLNNVLSGYVESIRKRNKEKSYSYRKDKVTIDKLNEISQVFDELAVTFEKAADEQSNYNVKEVYELIDNVASNVCISCNKSEYCWQQKFYNTYSSMFKAICILEEGAPLTEANMPDLIKENCISKDDIKIELYNQFEALTINSIWEEKIIKNRLLVSEQFHGVAKIMKGMIQDIYISPTFNEDTEQMIYDELRKGKVDVIDVVVMELEKDNTEIYVEIDKGHKDVNSQENIRKIISGAIGIAVKGQYNMNQSDDRRQKLKFIRANRYGALTEVISKPNYLNDISGDNYTFGEGDNLHYLAISDGMGIGRKANNESNIAINLFEKFLEAKFDRELALKTINSMLMLKSNDEIFATFDISLIDLYSGRFQIIKTGAPATFIKKKDRVEMINSQSLPVGILKDVDFNIYEEYLEDGDIIIMMSDGLLDANEEEIDAEGWMKDLILNIESVNPKAIGEEIMEKAKEVSGGTAKDDMTVLVTKVWKTIN